MKDTADVSTNLCLQTFDILKFLIQIQKSSIPIKNFYQTQFCCNKYTTLQQSVELNQKFLNNETTQDP